MNILFALYGGFHSNSAIPLALYARELQKSGHSCAVAVPSGMEAVTQHENPAFRPILYGDVLAAPDDVFPDGRPADAVHACTPREVVRQFITSYMAMQPTPLVVYLEDNEYWVSLREVELDEASLYRHTEAEISRRLPLGLSHPFLYGSFIGLADAVAVIQDKLKVMVPPWVHCETVMIGVDIEFFSPRPQDASLRTKCGIAADEKVIVYHGGIDPLKRPAMEALCRAVGLINLQGFRCRLLRTGLTALDFLDQLPTEAASAISDLGVLPRRELPDLLALADVFVQPGQPDPFEDLRLPGKVPEFLAMGRPVIMPDTNIAPLFRDGVDVLLLRSGTPEEIAAKCIELFSDSERADRIGAAGRMLAEKYFDVRNQARRLESMYINARARFNAGIAAEVWQKEPKEVPIALRLVRKLKRSLATSYTDSGDGYTRMLHEHIRYMETMQKRISALDQVIREKDIRIGNLHHIVKQREDQIGKQTLAISEIYKSTSWRVSAPVRFAGRLLMQIRTLLRALPNALAICGGYADLLRRVWKTYKYEGIDGIRLRIQISAAPGGPRPALNFTNALNSDYKHWVGRYDTLTDEDRRRIAIRIKEMHRTPLISVLMPVYDPPLHMLEEAIQSVQQQLYTNWELCIADDASKNPAVRELLQRYAGSDSRIKVVYRDRNGHISAASNSALALVRGEYVALLDNDDLLREHALFWVADAILTNSEAGLVYSDEDKIDWAGERRSPYFKPDWNPDLFLSQNFVCHLSAYRTDLIRELGGFREGYEGAQDYDLALRCIEKLSQGQIVHVPRVLYHWRIHEGSTARGGRQKQYAQEAGARALNDHFARVRVAAKVEMLDYGMYRARYELPSPPPLVTLIIPTRNRLNLIRQCIESILSRTTYEHFEILVVDNNSDDPDILDYFRELHREQRVRVCRDERPFNFAALNNAAVRQANGEYVGLVNNDIEVISPEWLDEMMSLAIQPGVGAVGARLWYPNDTLQHGGVITGYGGVAGHAHKHLPRGHPGYFVRAQLIQNMSAVTAACLVVKKSTYQEVGGLDEVNLKVAFNDVDFCLRLREAGYRNVWTPYAELYHHESATRGYDDTSEKRRRFRDEGLYMRERWGEQLMNDPVYNPNLTLDREDFSFSWPPRVSPI